MSTPEKIKKTILIALGFAFATYLIMSGMAMLDQDEKTEKQESLNEQNNSK